MIILLLFRTVDFLNYKRRCNFRRRQRICIRLASVIALVGICRIDISIIIRLWNIGLLVIVLLSCVLV